jgi:hypothetical protein
MFPKPAVSQAEIDAELAQDEWSRDINCGEIYGEVD